MPRNVLPGEFYAFDRGEPNFEIGGRISRNQALFRVRGGGDVYTPAGSDAASLAKDAYPGKAFWEGAHLPRAGDWDAQAIGNRRYPHYHPGGNHHDFGHVFYGERGFRAGEARRD